MIISEKFYISPKLHKEGNRSPPVVSSINSRTANMSKYVDCHLKPIVKQIPSCVKDTKDFINKIDAVKSVPNNYQVAMDVRSLNINIPNAEGILAVKRAFNNYSKKTNTIKVITTILALLTMNNFVFDCMHYLQVKGCTMSTLIQIFSR